MMELQACLEFEWYMVRVMLTLLLMMCGLKTVLVFVFASTVHSHLHSLHVQNICILKEV